MKEKLEIWFTIKNPYPTEDDIGQLAHNVWRYGLDEDKCDLGIIITPIQNMCIKQSLLKTIFPVSDDKIIDRFFGFKIKVLPEVP